MSGRKDSGSVEPVGGGAARLLTPEQVAEAERAFPLGIDTSTDRGRWAAEQIAKGVRPIDVYTALERGAHPPGAPREES